MRRAAELLGSGPPTPLPGPRPRAGPWRARLPARDHRPPPEPCCGRWPSSSCAGVGGLWLGRVPSHPARCPREGHRTEGRVCAGLVHAVPSGRPEGRQTGLTAEGPPSRLEKLGVTRERSVPRSLGEGVTSPQRKSPSPSAPGCSSADSGVPRRPRVTLWRRGQRRSEQRRRAPPSSVAGLEDRGPRAWPAGAHRALPCLQGRSLSFKTFLVWVLISIYQGKRPPRPTRGSCLRAAVPAPAQAQTPAVASAPGDGSCLSRQRVSRRRRSLRPPQAGCAAAFTTDERRPNRPSYTRR